MSIPFISCDWGTSSFRLRLVTGGNIEAELSSGHGIRTIHDELTAGADQDARDKAFAGYLNEKTNELMPESRVGGDVRHVVISGMVTSTIGWHELPYAKAPCDLDGSQICSLHLEPESTTGSNLQVRLVSGLRTENDVMRGEETELIGILNHDDYRQYAHDSLVLMPGTHSKHVRVQQGQIKDWQTFLTGELFESLTTHTILRQTTAVTASAEHSESDFREGAKIGFESGMEPALFQARTRGVIHDITSARNREFLSGLLIASELRHALRNGKRIPMLIVGRGSLTDRYHLALELAGELGIEVVETVPVDLPEGAAAILGHSFLLKRWLDTGEIEAT